MMTTATLLIIAKTCPLTDEWVKKMWHTHTHGVYTHVHTQWTITQSQ